MPQLAPGSKPGSSINRLFHGTAVSMNTRQTGFSLVEILVVLVIMGLLISIVAPTVLNRADEARVQKAQADFKAIETALKIYKLDNYVYPTTEQGLEALVEAVRRNFHHRVTRTGIAHLCQCLLYLQGIDGGEHAALFEEADELIFIHAH